MARLSPQIPWLLGGPAAMDTEASVGLQSHTKRGGCAHAFGATTQAFMNDVHSTVPDLWKHGGTAARIFDEMRCH